MAGSFLKYGAILLFLSTWWSCSPKMAVVQSVQGEQITYFTSDKLQQFYLINGKEELLKYQDLDAAPQFLFSNQLLGQPGFVDATNPFNLVLYYPQYGKVRFLDRTLSEIGALDLFDKGVAAVSAVARSSDNHIWYYDEVQTRLIKIGQEGTIMTQSDRTDMLLGMPLQVKMIQEHGQRVYLADPTQGLVVFDVFGQYLLTVPVKGVHDFQILNGQLIYLQNGNIHRYDLQTSKEIEVALPEAYQTATQLRQVGDTFYVLWEGKVVPLG